MDREADGSPMRAPGSIYDAPYVVGSGVVRNTDGPVNLGWRPNLKIPDTYRYFGRSDGRKNDRSENEQAPTLGNKWKRK